MAPDTIETFKFYPLGGGTIWPLTNGTKELTETVFETVGCDWRVIGIDDTRVFRTVGYTGTKVIAYWEFMFVKNEPNVCLMPDAHIELW